MFMVWLRESGGISLICGDVTTIWIREGLVRVRPAAYSPSVASYSDADSVPLKPPLRSYSRRGRYLVLTSGSGELNGSLKTMHDHVFILYLISTTIRLPLDTLG